MHPTSLPSRVAAPDPRLEQVLRRLVVAGALLVLVLPAARGQLAWIGALPLWLLGMPLASWWALHRFRLPGWRGRQAPADGPRRRRRGGQALRRRSAVRPLRAGRRAA